MGLAAVFDWSFRLGHHQWISDPVTWVLGGLLIGGNLGCMYDGLEWVLVACVVDFGCG
jgi:hypothetical protein